MTVESVNNYINESLKSSSEKLLFNKIAVFVKDPLPEDINIDHVLSSIEERIPEHLIYAIDMVYIGQFEEFEKRDTNIRKSSICSCMKTSDMIN